MDPVIAGLIDIPYSGSYLVNATAQIENTTGGPTQFFMYAVVYNPTTNAYVGSTLMDFSITGGTGDNMQGAVVVPLLSAAKIGIVICTNNGGTGQFQEFNSVTGSYVTFVQVSRIAY